ncbi:hypothetical protein BZA77DRAFT_299537 [Pyronema omphalodes]|nr:hypothetical protein BZA77DRAFT_299537 [Pyronema omphalodes]
MSNLTDHTLATELAEYEASRAALIAEEQALRHDHAFRQRLSPVAKQASAIISKIRAKEAASVWAKVEEQEGDVFPGMCFTLAKERMERTELWKIVKKFPKGALLHAHLEAMVDMDWLLDHCLATKGMHMFSDRPLTTENLETADVQFTFRPETVNSAASIYTNAYEPSSLVPVNVAADTFPSSGSPQDAFRAWFKSRTTITPDESMKHHEGINLIWAKFQSIFGVIQQIIYYEPIFRAFVREVLENVYDDGCSWADIRIAFVMTFQEAETGRILENHDVVRVFGEVVEEFKKANPGFWGARVIYTDIRIFGPERIMESMQSCIDAKLKHPAYLSGFDLVGQEDKGRTLREHASEFLKFKRMCAEANVDIPLFLHAGETAGDGSETDNNLFDAVLLGAKRIGHGFSMFKHPHLMKLARERGICMEVCPISNEILRLTASIMSHPLPAYMAHGVPVSINNDDPGILGQTQTGSLTHDYWQVLQAYDNVGLEGLGDLAETGVRYAAFDGVPVGIEKGIRKERMHEWNQMWENFCAWVVETYGDKV